MTNFFLLRLQNAKGKNNNKNLETFNIKKENEKLSKKIIPVENFNLKLKSNTTTNDTTTTTNNQSSSSVKVLLTEKEKKEKDERDQKKKEKKDKKELEKKEKIIKQLEEEKKSAIRNERHSQEKDKLIVLSNVVGRPVEEEYSVPIVPDTIIFNMNQLKRSSEFMQIQELDMDFCSNLKEKLSLNPFTMATQVFSVVLT